MCSVLGHLAPVLRCARCVCCVACAVSWATWLLFTGVPARCVALRVPCPGPLGSCSPVCLLGVLPVCAVSWAIWLLFTGVPARCLVLLVRCPGPPGSCSPVCPLGVLFCLCGVLGHLAPVHRCARSVPWMCVRCPWRLGSCPAACPLGALLCVCGVLGHLAPVHRRARSVRWMCVRCPWRLGSCSPACPLGVLFCVCGVLGHLAPVHRCARSVCCFACAVSWATWLLFTDVPARCVVLRVRCPGPLGSCSPVCPLGVLCCMCGVLGHLAPVLRCARCVCCVACAVSLATWLLFTGVPARRVVLRVRCPGPLGSCSPLCPLGALLCVCGVLGHLAPVHQCARSVRWMCVRCPWRLGSCSPACPLGVLFCVCGVLGHLAPVHRCARSVCCFACAVSWATSLLFTDVPARCVVLRVRCPGPPGSCSPVCPLGALFCLCGVLGHLAPVHQCARSVCYFAGAVSWATWLLFTGVPARSVASCLRCPGPPVPCSPVCSLGVLFFLCGVLGHLAPVHRCARSVHCLCVRCPWPLGSCSPVCPLRALFCLCGVLGHLAPVLRCACSVCCVVCAVSWATWLLFTVVPARTVVLHLRCPGPLGSCSPVRSPGVLCGVLGHLAPVHRCARSACCAVGCVCGALLRGAHSSIRTVAICSRQGLDTLRARTRLSERRLFVAGRGWVPSRRTRVHPEGGCSVAGRGWVCCRARTRPFGRRLVLVRTCPRALVRCVLCALSGIAATGGRCCLAPVRVPWLWPAACLSGVPRGPTWCAAPRPVLSLSVLRSAFPTPWCVSPPRGLAPLALLGGCAGHAEAGPEPGSLCLPLAPAKAGALGSLRVVPVCSPVMRLSLAGSSGVGLGLRVLRWLVCVDPVTDASSFPYRPSFDRGLHRCTGAVSCGHQHLPLRVGGRHARVPCVCACACSSWPGGAGRPPGRVLVRLTFSFGRFRFLLCLAPSGLRLPLSWSFVCHPLPPFAFSFRLSVVVFLAPPLSPAFSGFRPRVPSALALCVVCSVGLALLGSPCALACFVFPARLLAAPWRLLPARPSLPFCFSLPLSALGFFFFLFAPRCLRPSLVFGPGCPGPWRCVLFVLWASRCPALRALSPRLCVPPDRWLLPGGCCPPPLLCLAVFAAAARCSFLFFSCVVRPRCLWLSLVSGPGCPGPRRCALFALLASRFPALRALSPPSCFPPRRWLLPGGCCPPLCLAVFAAAAPCCVPCAVLCCVSLGAVLRRAAARCAAGCCAVVCCVALLRSFCVAACCAVPSGFARRPGALCAAALCFAVFPRAVCSVLCVVCRGVVVRAVVRRSALCCVCTGVLCCAFPVLSALCGAVLRCAGALAFCCSCGACCCRRLLLWCAAVCCAVSYGVLWCGAGSGGPWLSAGGVFRCWCPRLAAWSASLWLVWFAVVPCFPVSCSVVLCSHAVLCCCALLSCCGAAGSCFALLWPFVLSCVVPLVGCAVFCPVVVSACFGAFSLVLCVPCLLRSVRCCALLCWLWCPASLCRVLWRCAVTWCCSVVLCCPFAVLFVLVLPSCGLSCGAVLCCVVLLVVCAVFCLVVAIVCCGALSLPAGTHATIPHIEKKQPT